MKLNIMGTDYEYTRDDLNNPDLAENDGCCLLFDKEIMIRKRQYLSGKSEKAKISREEHVIRHEVVHALAQETGVEYGDNEPLVDWIAHIIPYVNKAVDDIKKNEEEQNAHA